MQILLRDTRAAAVRFPPTEHLAALIKPHLIHSGGGWAEGCRTSEAEAAEK